MNHSQATLAGIIKHAPPSELDKIRRILGMKGESK